MYETMMQYHAITAAYNLSNSQIRYHNSSLSLNKIKDIFSKVYIADLGTVKNITKRYIRENLDDNSYFIKNDTSIFSYIRSYRQRVEEVIETNHKRNKQGYMNQKELYSFDIRAFKVICRHLLSKAVKLQIFSDKNVSQKWILDTKAADKLKRGTIKKQGFDWKQNINVHELRGKDYGGGVMTDSKPYKMKDLSTKFKSLTVYGEKNNKRIRTLFSYCKSGVKPKLVELAPTKIKLLKNVDNFVKIEDFMSTDYKLIRNIGTVEFLKEHFPHLKDLSRIGNLNLISERLATVVKDLAKFVDKYKTSASRHSSEAEEKILIKEIYDICKDKDYFNEEIRGLFNKHKKELLNAKVIIDLAPSSSVYSNSIIPSERVNAIVDYLLVRKLVRPSVKAVLKLKKETIFNLKLEENENNEN